MPKSTQRVYNTGGVCGQHVCPCGYTFTGFDQRTRDRAKKLHKLKCEIGANTESTAYVTIPDAVLINPHTIEQAKKQLYNGN